MTLSVSVSYEPDRASTLAQADCAKIARTGTFERGDRRARLRKNRPSRAIANGMRELASTLACSAPNEETISATAVIETASGPRKRFSTSVATDELAGTSATSRGVSAKKYAELTNKYRAATVSVPPTKARGRLRCGSRISPDSGATFCQPSYAQSAPSMAAPKPATPPRALLATPSHVPAMPDCAKCPQSPDANTKAPIPTLRTSPTLAIVSNSAMRPPAATEAQLINATVQMAARATRVRPLRWEFWACAPTATCQRSKAPPNATFMKIASPTASAACDPARATVNAIQPYRNPTRRP